MTHDRATPLHIHLDAVGGMAGDMFLAALLSLRPDLFDTARAAARAAGLPAEWSLDLVPHAADGFAGHRFVVARRPDDHHDHHDHDHDGHHHHGHDHGRHHGHVHGDHHHHVTHREIAARIDGAGLAAPVRARARAIFARLAEAEGAVHGVAPDDVSFHEVADWDSVADIVGAAAVIEALGPAVTWSVSALPLGSGMIRTQHGRVPVPAPATALLMKGFLTHDDGLPGERVTPTGAAILAHLEPSQGPRPAGRLLGAGVGFGTRRFPGLPNILRALALAPQGDTVATESDEVVSLAFEVDDQTAEDLALALDRVRAVDGVLDVIQFPAFGKKGRMGTAVRVLCRPAAREAAIAACLTETTTLGVRVRAESRRVLARDLRGVAAARVKVAFRPGGPTAKADIDDLSPLPGGHAGREAARREIETQALNEMDAKPS